MDYGAAAAASSADVASILKTVSETQAATGVTAAPVVTESLDLDAIYQATYEAEMAKYNAQTQSDTAAVAAAMEASTIETIVNYDEARINAMMQAAETGFSVQNTLVPQDLSNISQLLADYNSVSPVNLSGGLTAGGFVMPEGIERETVYKIIAAEGGNVSPQEAVNIASTMINRARSGGWNGGNDIYKVATAKNQYVVYQNGNYKSAALTPESRAAVDLLFTSASTGGATAHNYQSFRSSGSTSYGGTQLVPGGNRYK